MALASLPATQLGLERDELDLSMADRLLAAAERLETASSPDAASSTLRPEQQPVFASFCEFLLDLATCPAVPDNPPLCRIVLPPRTGKTVVAAHIIERTGLTATFVVPTRNLVRQVAAELETQLEGVPVGMYYGDVKNVVEHGVNVATYSILQKRRSDAELPIALRTAGLIIADEAHHAMTESRMDLLVCGFDPLAVRLALTATPDYNRTRRLCHHFPNLIHEITLYEALRLELLAPLRLWVAEVDADASRVRMIAGDYDQETLGRLMSTAPFFRTTQIFRYSKENADLPALLCCASRQQAYDLTQYLREHRPAASPAPRLILGETPDDERLDTLARFERGDIDTIVQVGVLIEGWSSPRCKLLVDLAPSHSRVRATQKFFRVMTRYGDREARIYVLIPNGLPDLPILPTDLFGNPYHEYVCGTLLASRQSRGSLELLDRTPRTPVRGVRVKRRIVAALRFEKPTIDPGDLKSLREVLRACSAWDLERPCTFRRFQQLRFEHPSFSGTGALLLDHVGVRDKQAYQAWLARVSPEAAATLLLKQHALLPLDRPCQEDVVWLLERGDGSAQRRLDGWLALGAKLSSPAESAEEMAVRCERGRLLHELLGQLRPRTRDFLVKRFGLNGEHGQTYSEIGEQYGITGGRVTQVVAHGLRLLHRGWRRADLLEGESRIGAQRHHERRAHPIPFGVLQGHGYPEGFRSGEGPGPRAWGQVRCSLRGVGALIPRSTWVCDSDPGGVKILTTSRSKEVP